MTAGTRKAGQGSAPDFDKPDFEAPDFGAQDFGTPDFGTPDFGAAPKFETPGFEAPSFETPDFGTPPPAGAPAGGFEAPAFEPQSFESPSAAAPQAPETEALAALTAERDELRDKLMRALAEAENVRRRAERDRKDAETFGGVRLARDLLSVHDNLARALAAATEAERAAAATLIEGVELTQRELLSAFARHKVEPVVPASGEPFDPNLHQAMFEAPVPGATPGTVIETMQPGFTMAGRLLRPALVGVAKAG